MAFAAAALQLISVLAALRDRGVRNSVIWFGCLLFAASSLFLVRSSYEMFVLTPLYGPQMVFFSLVHTWPYPAIMAFFASWYAYYALVLFAIFFAVARLTVHLRPVGLWVANVKSDAGTSQASRAFARFVGCLPGPAGHSWSVIVYVGAAALLLHFAAATTYDRWSGALFSARG